MVTAGSPVSPTVVISVSGAEAPLNPLVSFEVIQNEQVVFSNTVSAGTLVTGSYQVEASESWLPDTTGRFSLIVTVDADNRVEETNESDNTLIVTHRVLSPLPQPRPEIEAPLKDEAQSATSQEIKLDVSQTLDTMSAPAKTLLIQLYQHQAGDNPNHYVPLEIDEQAFTQVSLPAPEFSLTLPDSTRPGPVVLHVWAYSTGGPAVEPQVVEFNYIPPSSYIEAGEEEFFTYYVRKGERLQLDLDLLDDGDANLFVWDPLNYGPPIWRGTYVGNDTITIDPAPASGKYIVGVYGETNATYSLTRGTSVRDMAQESRLQNNPDAYVPQARPTFFEPIPSVPEVPVDVEMVVDNADSDQVSITGSWESSTVIDGYVGADYLHDQDQDKGAKSVRFTPPITKACTYQVELNWTAHPNRATNVPVDIKHANGMDTVTLNQQENGGEWNPLGSYTFSADGSEYVELRTDGTDGHVIADAVRLVAVVCEEPATSVQISPPSSAVMVSDLITVEIGIDYATDIYGAQVELSFDPTKLEVVDADDYSPGTQIEDGDLLQPDTTIRNKADNNNGTIEYAISLQGEKPGVNGSGILARIHFRAIGAGVSPISVTNALLSTPDAQPIDVVVSAGQVEVLDVEELSVSGTVLLADQSDYSGTEACADADIEDNCVTTGADGSYLLEHLPLTGTISFRHQGYVSATRPYEGTLGEQITLPDVTLIKAELTVSGKVTLEHRDTYEGVEVCHTNNLCVTTPAEGTYTLENVPLTGTLTFKYPYYLSEPLDYAGEVGELISLPDVELTAGDLSQNGQIDIDDAVIIGLAWNSQPGAPNWDPRADLNQDEKVNILDVVIIQRNWGKESTSSGRAPNLRQGVSSDTLVLISPANNRLSGEGESLEMEIQVQNVSNLYGGSVVVTFDPTLLQVRDFNPNQDGVQIRPGEFLDANNQLIIINRVDNQTGIIEFAVTQTYPAEATSGNGILGTITFDTISEGSSDITLTDVRLLNGSRPDPQAIDATTQDGQVQIGQQKIYLPLMQMQHGQGEPPEPQQKIYLPLVIRQ